MSANSYINRVPLSNKRLLVLLDNMIWPILAVVCLGIAIIVPQTFRNFSSIQFVLHSSVGLGFLVLAESICLISGHFDLSVGAIAGFSAMLAAMIVSSSKWALISDPILGIGIILVIGLVLGTVNGTMIAKLGINPFLQTLAALIILQGGKLALSTSAVGGLPEGYTYLGNNAWSAVSLLLFAYLLIGVVMRHTPFGQAIYALGSDKESTRAVGINTDRMTIVVYAISGLLSATAGLMLTGYTSVVSVEIARDTVFPAFAASVIGGISLFGGRGKVSGALGGVALLGVIQSALSLSGTPVEQIQLTNGLVLLAAIILYNSQESLRDSILSSEV